MLSRIHLPYLLTDFCLEPSTSNSAAPLMSNNVPHPTRPATRTSAQQGIPLISDNTPSLNPDKKIYFHKKNVILG